MAYLCKELNYPGLKQAAVLRKSYRVKDGNPQKKTEIWYLLTSQDSEKLPPRQFLETTRKHWQIENGLHHVKDRSMKEDAHVLYSPEQGKSLAILRNVVVSVLNLFTPPKKRKISRPMEFLEHGAHPLKALKRLASL